MAFQHTSVIEMKALIIKKGTIGIEVRKFTPTCTRLRMHAHAFMHKHAVNLMYAVGIGWHWSAAWVSRGLCAQGVLEEMRLKLVDALKNGNTLLIRLTDSAPDLLGDYHSDNSFPAKFVRPQCDCRPRNHASLLSTRACIAMRIGDVVRSL